MLSRDLVVIAYQSGSCCPTQTALWLVAEAAGTPPDCGTANGSATEWQKGRIAAALRQPKFVRDENTALAKAK